MAAAARVPAAAAAVRDVRDRAARADIMVVAAALTGYAAIGLVPLLAAAVRIAAALLGATNTVATADALARYLPGPLHLDHDVRAFVRSAARAPWWTVLVALLPASLFAEGAVRALERLSTAPERRSRTVRGRLLTGVLLAAACAVVVLLVGVLRPLLDNPYGTGAGARVLGLVVGFHVLVAVTMVLLAGMYRLFASTPVRRGPLLVAAFVTAGWIGGQTLGFLLVLRLAGRVGNAYGDFAAAAEVGSFAFLVYFESLVVLLGYLLALHLHDAAATSEAGDQSSGR